MEPLSWVFLLTFAVCALSQWNACIYLSGDVKNFNLCATNSWNLQYLGEFSTLVLVNSTLFWNSGTASFNYRVYDSFEPDIVGPAPPALVKVSAIAAANTYSAQIGATLTAVQQSRGLLDNATGGRVRTLEILWMAQNSNVLSSAKVYFTQVPPQRVMLPADADLIQNTSIIVVGGGFMGLTAAKILKDATPGQIAILDNSQLLTGYDDIMTSRSVAETTTNHVAVNGSIPPTSSGQTQLFLAVMDALKATSADIEIRRESVRVDLSVSGIAYLEQVPLEWIQNQLAIYNGTIIDARGGCRILSFRENIVRVLLNTQLFINQENPQTQLYGFSYAAHTLLPTAIALGLTTTIHSTGAILKPSVYNSSSAMRAMTSVLDYWTIKGFVVQVSQDRFKANCDNLTEWITNITMLGKQNYSQIELNLCPPNITIVLPLKVGTADLAILETMQLLATEYANSDSQLSRLLTKPPASSVVLFDVEDFKGAYSTAEDPPFGIVQFYGIPTVGWAGYYDDGGSYSAGVQLSSSWIELREFYPPSELDQLSLFLTGQPATNFSEGWGFHVYTNQNKELVGISGNFFAPLIIDLFRPFLHKSFYFLYQYLHEYSSNRGNWQTDLVRDLLEKAIGDYQPENEGFKIGYGVVPLSLIVCVLAQIM